MGQTTLNGAGATFPYPMYSKWFSEYHKAHPEVEINYQSIGSGGGIRQVLAGTVDFGASDGPMSDEQLAQYKNGKLFHIPTVMGAVVPAYNVPGVTGELKFSPEALAGIFLGKITAWNDPAIASLNPGVSLPSTHITPIYRSDGSGTSFVVTDYLSSVSSEWASKVGTSTQPTFPTGTGAEHSSGVIAAMQSTDGGITYAEVSYVAADNLDYALLQNAAGNYPKPTNSAVLAATKVGTTRPDGTIKLVNPPASASSAYPLASYTYVIAPKSSPKASTLRAFISWAISPTGQAFGEPIGYPPLPANVVSSDKALIAQIK